MQLRRSPPRLIGLLFAAVVVTALCDRADAGAWAEGGIEVKAEAKWPGCGFGGYFPVRLNVVNRDKPHNLTFTFASNYGRMPTVSRTVAVETGRTNLRLLVPCVAHESYGTVRVQVDGRQIDALSESVSLPGARDGSTRGPAVLYVATVDADWTNFITAVESIVGASTASTSSGYYGPTVTAGEDHLRVAPEELPSEWQAYSGVDVVAADQRQFEQLPAGIRAGILEWVETGGTLLLLAVDVAGKAPAEAIGSDLGPLNQSLGFAGERQPEWMAAGSDVGRFFHRPYRLGQVVAVPANPFSDYGVSEWDSLLRSIGGTNRWEWSDRFGFSARHPSVDFLEFLIPSVKGVPVIAFLVLITLFAIVIGPVNYVVLYRKRRLYLLVITIPLIALVTSLSLFGYSAIAHGFATRSRVRSLTLLDQRTNRAVSASRVSLYSGLAPSSGLQFSRNSAVYPIWAPDAGFESGTVDWTDTQHFASGWLRSRTRTQFFVVTPRDERGRLEVKPTADKLSVANGLEWDIAAIVIADDAGRLFYGEVLPAGEAANLATLNAEEARSLARKFNENTPFVPSSVADYASRHATYGYGYGYGYYGAPQFSFKTNFAEQRLAPLTRAEAFNPQNILPRTYVALLDDNPGIDTGVQAAEEEVSLHVLFGKY